MLKEKVLTANVLMALAMIAVCVAGEIVGYQRYVNEMCWCALIAIANLLTFLKISNLEEEESE